MGVNGASQLTKSGIGMTLYEKRGRNSKGPVMFHHMGAAAQVAAGGGGSDMNVGGAAQHSMPNNLNSNSTGPGGASGLHQRNKTQIVGVENGSDSVFRNSIMSTDHIKLNKGSSNLNQANGNQNNIQ